MMIVAIAWIYVVLMVAVAEGVSRQGTVLGAIFTFLLYGVLPLSVVLYILGAPGRRRARRAAEAEEAAEVSPTSPPTAPTEHEPSPLAFSSQAPDGRSVAAGDAIAAERKEP